MSRSIVVTYFARGEDSERAARVASWIVGVVCLTVLVGWYSGVTGLTTVFPGTVSMKPNAALSLLILATALAMRDRRSWRVSLGACAVVIGCSTLTEHVLDRSLGIDQLMPGIEFVDSPRMAPATALAIVLLGGALIADEPRRSAPARWAALLAFVLGYVAAVGYAYGASSLYGVQGYTAMAIHTATSILVLSLALVFLQGDAGMVGLIRDRGTAGRLMRPMVPFLLLGPVALGGLRLWAQQRGWFDTEFGVAVLVLCMTGLGGAVTWRAAVQLRAIDRERADAATALAESNRTLETKVEARTEALRVASERLSSLIRVAPVAIVETDTEGGVLTTNPGWQVLSGLTQHETMGAGWAAAVHPDDLGRVRAEWAASAAAGQEHETTYRLVTSTGEARWVHATTTPLRNDDGVLTGHLAAIADVTALVSAQDTAIAAQARFRAAFDSSPLGTALVSQDGTILESNRRLAQLTSRSTEEIVGKQAEDLFETRELPDQASWLGELVDGTIASHRMERQLCLGYGPPTWVEVSVAAIREGAQVKHLLYALVDVTARRLAESRVEHMALHDTLTGLPNRLLLLDRLSQALNEATRRGSGIGVLFIDLDRFKVVNDSLGHHAGDIVLRQVAARLSDTARATDTVARLGGDEFVVVCPDITNSKDVLEIATKLRKAVARPISCGEQSAVVDASIGVAFSVGRDDPEALLRNADQAMYQAKDFGRARSEVFDSDLRGRIQRRLDTELGLRAAVERNEIETWYQPIVDLQESAVVANEALARWRRPGPGILMPDTFIAVAEETGAIEDIGAAVLTQACLAAAALPGGPAISVNVSARQFAHDDFGAVVQRALRVSQLPPDRLWLELTEGVLVEAVDAAASTFQGLRDQGVLLAIDDFGTGFSSFEHLRSFTADVLKIDMAFVQDVERSDRDRAIVEGILRLADSLDIDVVAEGIETTAQRDLLRGLGCRFGQGYLFGRPSPIAFSHAPPSGGGGSPRAA